MPGSRPRARRRTPCVWCVPMTGRPTPSAVPARRGGPVWPGPCTGPWRPAVAGADRRDHPRPGRGPVGEVRRGRDDRRPDCRRRSPTSPRSDVGDDADLAARVARHRARRPSTWRTVEAGPDLPGVLRAVAGIGARGLPRSVGERGPGHGGRRRRAVLGAGRARRGHVSWSPRRSGSRCTPRRKRAGSFATRWAPSTKRWRPRADEVVLVVAGRTLRSRRARRLADAQGARVPHAVRRCRGARPPPPWTGSRSWGPHSGWPWGACGGRRDGRGRRRPRPAPWRFWPTWC